MNKKILSTNVITRLRSTRIYSMSKVYETKFLHVITPAVPIAAIGMLLLKMEFH